MGWESDREGRQERLRDRQCTEGDRQAGKRNSLEEADRLVGKPLTN